MVKRNRKITSINTMNMFNLMDKTSPPNFKQNGKKINADESFDSLFHNEIEKLNKKV